MAETKTSPTPESFLKRSPLYLALGNRGAQFTEIDGAAVADGFGDGDESENLAIREMAICDLSPLPRLGFKGKGALEWLREQGVAVGDEQMAQVNLKRHDFHGDWNYTIHPIGSRRN